MSKKNENKLCYVTNIAAHYRSAIYLLMDKSFDMDFIFGDHEADKRFDVSLLHNPTKVIWNTKIGKRFDYQKGIPFLFTKYDTILITGNTHCVSTWLLLLLSYPFRNKKIYLWSHAWYGKESRMERFVKKIFFGMASGTFTYGDRAKKLMVENGLNGDKIWPLHNCLDHEAQLGIRNKLSESNIYRDKFNNNNPNLIFIGRLTPVKKLDMVVKALAICKEKGHDYNMTFIGDGPMMRQLQDEVKQNKLDDRVWFYGACHDEEKNGELIYNADLCVSPGNVGLTAVHCMTFGTPVITNDDYSHQMPEFETIKSGETGDFFENGSSESLADQIISWIESKKHREEIRQNCYRVIDTEWTPEYQIRIMKEHLISH